MSWAERAACKGKTALFFPLPRGGVYHLRERKDDPYAAARAICAECPVQQECLDFSLAIANREQLDGMFGGLDDAERLELRRLQRRDRRSA